MSRRARNAAVTYRIWSWCNTYGWEHTPTEIAEGVGPDVSAVTVGKLIAARGWSNRIRHGGLRSHRDELRELRFDQEVA